MASKDYLFDAVCAGDYCSEKRSSKKHESDLFRNLSPIR